MFGDRDWNGNGIRDVFDILTDLEIMGIDSPLRDHRDQWEEDEQWYDDDDGWDDDEDYDDDDDYEDDVDEDDDDAWDDDDDNELY